MAGQKIGRLLGTHPNTYTNQRLLAEARELDLALDFLAVAEVSLAFPTTAEFSICADFIIARILGAHFDDFDLEVLTFLQAQNCISFNSAQGLRLARSKLTQARVLSAANVSILPSLALRGPWCQRKQEEIYRYFRHRLGPLWSGDFVLKFERGHQGKGVILAKGKESLASLWESFESLQDQRLVLTPFVAGPTVRELRLFAIDGQAHLILERFPAVGDFRANFHLKSDPMKRPAQVIRPSELPSGVLAEALAALDVLGLFYGSVDFFLTPVGPMIIEANAVAGVEEAEAVGNINLSKELLLSIGQKLR